LLDGRAQITQSGAQPEPLAGSASFSSRKPMKLLMLTLLAAALSTDPPPAPGTELAGTVLAVADGDTLTLDVPTTPGDPGTPADPATPGAPASSVARRVKLRLNLIDAPERDQSYGAQARQALSELTFGKEVRVLVEATDRYGRTIGRLSVGSVDVSAELVRRGAAWVYRQYTKDPGILALEATAKSAKLGLWGLPEAERVPPWVWRHHHPAKTPDAWRWLPPEVFGQAFSQSTFASE
jgi:endonuclease YncB( thermonuclease family)